MVDHGASHYDRSAADMIDQQRPVTADDADLDAAGSEQAEQVTDLEADPADVADQRRAVPDIDDDEPRP